MMKMKKVEKKIADVVLKISAKAGNDDRPSFWGFCQPKAPEALKALAEKK